LAIGAGLVADGRVGETGGFLSSTFASGFDAAWAAGFGPDVLGAVGGSAGACAAEPALAASIAAGGSLPSNASPTPAMLET